MCARTVHVCIPHLYRYIHIYYTLNIHAHTHPTHDLIFFWSLNYKSTKAVDAMMLYYFCPVSLFQTFLQPELWEFVLLAASTCLFWVSFPFLEDGSHLLSLLTDSLYRCWPLAWHGRFLLAFWWLFLYVLTLLWLPSHTPTCLHYVFLNTLCQLSPYLMDPINTCHIVMTHKYLMYLY